MPRAASRYLPALALLVALAGCGATGAPAPTQAPTVSPTASPAPTASPTASPAPTSALAIGQPFQLRVGEAATLGGLTLTLAAIENDSRCPTKVMCAWEGAAEALVDVVADGQAQGRHKLTLNGKNRATAEAQVVVAEHTLRFVKLDPYPDEPQPIPEQDYVATFIVEAGALYTPVTSGGREGVIVPEQDADAFDPRAEGYWTPSAQDVYALESGLADFLRAAPAAAQRSPDLWEKQAGYKRQYAGLIRDGRRLVYASFFCDTMGDEWRRQVMVVADGGDCFFQLTYDVEKQSYDNLMINGDA